jgi:hypothetical protein
VNLRWVVQAEGHRSGAPRPTGRVVHRFAEPVEHAFDMRLGSSRRVPEAGFEPACPCGQMGLSHLCKPVPALGLVREKGSEVRSREEVAVVLELVRAGWNDCEIARENGIPRRTVRDWRKGRTPDFDRIRARYDPKRRVCVVCGGDPLRLPQGAYTYLLGLYLGDGCIATHPRGVFRLRIVCADAYPELIQRCEHAMAEVLPNKVNRVRKGAAPR